MKLDEFRQMGPADLRAKELEIREEIFRLRLKLRTNQLDNPSSYRKARKELARLQTVLRDKEIRPEAAEARNSDEAAG